MYIIKLLYCYIVFNECLSNYHIIFYIFLNILMWFMKIRLFRYVRYRLLNAYLKTPTMLKYYFNKISKLITQECNKTWRNSFSLFPDIFPTKGNTGGRFWTPRGTPYCLLHLYVNSPPDCNEAGNRTVYYFYSKLIWIRVGDSNCFKFFFASLPRPLKMPWILRDLQFESCSCLIKVLFGLDDMRLQH